MRVTDSEIRNEDIITGTEKKVIAAFDGIKGVNPTFAMLANAPGSSMISSDLESAADSISQSAGIPAGIVKVYGDKDFEYGASVTLETLAKMLLESSDKIAGSVNILGCNVADWTDSAVESLTKEIEVQGVKIISKWGAKGLTLESIRKASSASLNLVVNVCGLRAAQYMQSEFGIPYICGAPYGKEQMEEFLQLMKKALSDESFDSCSTYLNKDKEAAGFDALVIGEQYAANAIRRILIGKGYSNVRVLSFCEMDKASMEPGDKKLAGEDDLAEFADDEGLKLIVANPDYKMAANRDIQWIKMPNYGISFVEHIAAVDMVGCKLDAWIEDGMK